MPRTWLDKLNTLDDRAMRALDRRIAALYADALKDAIAECKRLMAAVEKLEKELTARQKADADTAGIERAIQTRRMALMREQGIEDKLASAFREAGEKVSEEVRQGMAEIYGLNKNATLDMVQRAAGQAYSFGFVREDQAYSVVLGLENAFDKVAYASLGNAETLKAAFRAEMAKAALLGEGQDKVVKRLKKQCAMETYRARRIAQTEHTRVQTRARLDAMEDAENAGVRTCKEWWASGDGKTRDTHQALNGQIVMTDEKFRSPSGALLTGPGDSTAPPGEVINCRCVLVPHVLLSDEVLVDGKICKKDADGLTPTADGAILKEVRDCKTVSEVENYMRGQGWFRVGSTDQNQLVSLSGCDLEAAQEVALAYKNVFDRYPAMKGRFDAVQCKLLDGGTYARCYTRDGGLIEINSQEFNDHIKLAASYDDDVQSGFHPVNTDWRSIVVHEIGHAVDGTLTNMGLAGPKSRYSYDYKDVSAEMRPKVMRACGLKVSDTFREVSGYATINNREWFAECFAELLYSPSPRRVAVEMGKLLDKYMKKVKVK